MHIFRYLMMAVVLMTVCCGLLAKGAAAIEPGKRDFLFSYKMKLKDVPPGEMKLWLPIAVSNEQQKVKIVKVVATVPLEAKKEAEYGNSLMFARLQGPAKGLEVEVQYEVSRFVERGNLDGSGKVRLASSGELARFMAPDRLVPLSERIRNLAADITKGKTTPVAKARAIYDYTVENLTYDKSGTGWGMGDINHACDVKRGNCTDFHALFTGLCRANGIPARFVIGFSIPEGKKEGEVAGYHCWAEFYLEGKGWIPVDTSEASKDKAKKGYYFGNLDENRVQFTQGRDILLDPRQQGERLNFFVYPYAELDGKPFNEMEKSFYFREISPGKGSQLPTYPTQGQS